MKKKYEIINCLTLILFFSIVNKNIAIEVPTSDYDDYFNQNNTKQYNTFPDNNLNNNLNNNDMNKIEDFHYYFDDYDYYNNYKDFQYYDKKDDYYDHNYYDRAE